MTSELHYRSGRFPWKETGLFFLAILLFTGALLYRRTDAFTNPQFWAEDGMVFFMEQDHQEEFLLFKNYNGYIHFLPRTVAFMVKSMHIPYEYVPTCYNYITYSLYIIYFLLLWRFIPFSSTTRLFMIAGLGILPVSPEVFMNLTNIQWFSALSILLLLFKFECKSVIETTVLTCLVTFAALTGPFSVILAPLILYRGWIERKKKANLIPFLIVLICGCIQLVFMINHHSPRPNPPLTIPNQHWLLPFYNSIKEVFFLDHLMISEIKPKHYIIIIPGLLILLSGILLDVVQRRLTKSILWGSFLLLCSATIFIHWPYEWLMTPFGMGARYFFILFGILNWLLIISFEHSKKIQVLIFIGLAILFISHYRHTKMVFVDFRWKEEARQYKETGEILAPINPPGMFILFREKKIDTH